MERAAFIATEKVEPNLHALFEDLFKNCYCSIIYLLLHKLFKFCIIMLQKLNTLFRYKHI